MAVVPFKAIEFRKDDIITKDSLDQLQNNYQWIHDNTPRGRFVRANGTPMDTLTVLMAGRVLFKKNKKTDSAQQRVDFAAGFSPQCNPIVTTGIVSGKQPRVHCAVTGIGNGMHPKNNGCIIKINIAANLKKNEKNDYIANRIWVHWHAFGYRTNNMPIWTGGN